MDRTPVVFEPITGPAMGVVVVRPEDGAGGVVIGRSAACGQVLNDPDGAVSRQHAELRYSADGGWRLRDVGSRHGTFVNGARLESSGRGVELRPADQVRIGPWTFRVGFGDTPTGRRLAHTSNDLGYTSTLVRRMGEQRLETGAQRRLELLMRLAGDLPGARSETQVAEVALDALMEGSGLPRGAIVRAASGEDVEIIASRGSGDTRYSRSLIHAAGEAENAGQTVVINPADRPRMEGESIALLDISAALCAPIMVERMPEGGPATGFASRPPPRAVAVADLFVYLDARGSESMVLAPETVAFCQAVARLCGLALSNLHRARVEQEDHRRRAELDAARDVQRIIMPPSCGRVAPAGLTAVTYHMRSIPGRHVAGDLFDFFPVGECQAAVLLGDVVGKGIAAGMVMANVQAHLAQLLRARPDPAAALTEVNRLVAQYSERLSAEHGRVSLFISLFAAVFDLRKGTLTYADAGHGYAILRRGAGAPERPFLLGGTPLGVAPESIYDGHTFEVGAGTRLFLFSDGLIEQPGGDGQAFGVERTLSALAGAAEAGADVDELVAALREHAPGDSFADDVTVAVVAVG